MNRILKHNTHGSSFSFGGRLHTCIVVPTTELALQYEQWFRFLGGYQQHPSTSAAQLVQIAVEEIPSTEQIHLLYNIQPHVLVGTPDRIHFIYQNSKTIFGGESLRKKIDCLVLDEADLLLAETDNHHHNKVSGVALVEKLFRREREEIPAQLVGVSASMDNHTARLLNTFVRNDSVARLTTSFVEQALPTSLNFFFFSIPRAVRAPADHHEEAAALRRVLTPVLRLIAKQYAQPKILLFVEESEHEKGKHVAQTVELLSSLLTEGALPEWAPHLRGSATFAQPLETFHDKHSNTKKTHLNTRRAAVMAKGNAIAARPEASSSAITQLNSGQLRIGVGPIGLARGLHVRQVTHVLLLLRDPTTALSSMDFLHCAGRTGRMSEEGQVLLLYSPARARNVRQLCQALDLPFRPTPLTQVEGLLENEGNPQFGAAENAEI
ncbi:ATP-dependent DEAD/H RNA helicase [Angomonas deanei]|nr:ATP-dependent DEAD/H RNA helicase [Angomonas deanei]|eukprot:EPY26446.1 ATP-dependent DEAD/H RNA helicase [Angomonas deanei]